MKVKKIASCKGRENKKKKCMKNDRTMKMYSSDFVKILVWNFLSVMVSGGLFCFVAWLSTSSPVSQTTPFQDMIPPGWRILGIGLLMIMLTHYLGHAITFASYAVEVWRNQGDLPYRNKLFYWDMVMVIGMWSLLFCILGWTELMISGALAFLIGMWFFAALIYRIMTRFG